MLETRCREIVMSPSQPLSSLLPALSRWAFALVTTLSVVCAAWLTQIEF
jgi:hypothetical protein